MLKVINHGQLIWQH